MNICVIRHGETDWNAAGRIQGREDIPLNENGRKQAEQCGLALKNQGEWDVVVTSPLLRARQTAEIIAELLNIAEIIVDDDLIEMDYGMASGKTREECAVLFPDGEWDVVESREVLRDRVYGAVMRNADKFSPKNILLVSHGGAINALLAKMTDGEIGSGKTRLKNGCMNMFTYEAGRLEMVFYNKAWDEVQDSSLCSE